MSAMPFKVWSEALLVPFGRMMVSLKVRLFEPDVPRRTVVCFHGFAGNGGDFDALAHSLALNGYLVVCPDMVGRGGSGGFDAPRSYTLRNSVAAAAAVLNRYGNTDAAIVASGWGAAIALVLLGPARTKFSRLLLAELPLDYSPASDPVLARAVADRGLVFASRGEAARHVLSSPEFAAAPAGDAGLVAHRLRPTAGGFRLNYDDGIVGRLDAFAGRSYALGGLLLEIGIPTLLLYGRRLDDASRAAVEALATQKPDLAWIDGITPAGPLLLRTPAELLLALGFIGNRLPAPPAAR